MLASMLASTPTGEAGAPAGGQAIIDLHLVVVLPSVSSKPHACETPVPASQDFTMWVKTWSSHEHFRLHVRQ